MVLPVCQPGPAVTSSSQLTPLISALIKTTPTYAAHGLQVPGHSSDSPSLCSTELVFQRETGREQGNGDLDCVVLKEGRWRVCEGGQHTSQGSGGRRGRLRAGG